MSTLEPESAGALLLPASAGCGGAVFAGFFLCPNPPMLNPPSALATADVAVCCATSPADGIAGLFDAGSGASEAAGNGSPLAVVPIRITCKIGTPFSLLVSF